MFVSKFFVAALAALCLVVIMSPAAAAAHHAPPLLTSLGNATLTLQRVIFAHRHGARTPSENLSGACGAMGCGELTVEGQGMLESLGEFFLRRYAIPTVGINRATGKANFDLRRVKAVTDDFPRCIQSAGAFWRGLFGSNEGSTSLGAAHLEVLTTDRADIIQPWSPPAFRLHTYPMRPAATAAANAVINATIIDDATVVAIGVEIGYPENVCQMDPAFCRGREFDYLSCMNSVGKLANFPLGAANYPKIVKAAAMVQQYQNGYYDIYVANNNFFSANGWPASGMLQAIVSDAADEGVAFSEFSAHDTSMMPLYAALGNLSFAYPLFGEALLFEVYKVSEPQARPGSKSPNLFVRAILGHPAQEPGSGWPYSFQPYTLVCVNSTTKLAYETDNGCPLADFSLFVASIQPPSGRCAAWSADLLSTNCTASDNTAASIDPSSPCGAFRSACPLEACGPSAFMRANLTCVSSP